MQNETPISSEISLEQYNPEFPVYISGEGFISLEEWERRFPIQNPPPLPEPLRTQLMTLPELPATITRLHCSNIMTLPELPATITRLHCSYNHERGEVCGR